MHCSISKRRSDCFFHICILVVHSGGRLFALMPPITALLHTENDGLRLGRTLEMLLPCDEFLIIDHGSSDDTCGIARRYGAYILRGDNRAAPTQYLDQAHNEWVLCMEAGESINEHLQASLFEWSVRRNVGDAVAHSVYVREQTVAGQWLQLAPVTRLVPRSWGQWHKRLPKHDPSAAPLEGELLRFAWP